MVQPAYQVENLWIERRSGDSAFRLEVPEFHVNLGEFVAVVGTTGCGKSTLLDMLALILRPDHAASFQVLCPRMGLSDLRKVSGPQRSRIRREALGYVLQSGGLLNFLSVKENILLPAKLKGGVRRKRFRLLELSRRLGIADQLRKSPQRLSGGQRQRAAIARALIHDPVIVLADEPTAAVDRITAAKIVEELRNLAGEEKVAVVMVTHDTGLVAPPVCDRAYTFNIKRADNGMVVSRCLEVGSWVTPR